MKKQLLCAALALGAAVVPLGLTGCAKQAQTLNLYTWEGMFPQEVLDGFSKQYNVKINYTNFDYDEDMLAKLEETKGGDYDVVIADDYILELAIRRGWPKSWTPAKFQATATSTRCTRAISTTPTTSTRCPTAQASR